MTAPVEVRRLTEDDWTDLRAVRLAMLLDTPFAYGSTYARDRAFTEATWRERAGGLVWMAWQGELPVGSVTLWADPEQPSEEIFLVGMWVASHARGEGVADALVEAAAAEAVALGRRRVVLEVAEGNLRARGAYRRLGFVETGTTRTSPAYENVCEHEMVLRLPG